MAPPVEITIPTTSVATPPDSKPFTQYTITLHLPLRFHVLQKRYSDFTALHQTLTTLVGAPPPAPLPAKHWFQSTVSSPQLTEDRRAALEAYLKAIAESPDRRWRDTPAWRTFLNLPAQHSAASAASSSGVTPAGRGIGGGLSATAPHDAAAAAARDPRTWMDLYCEAKALLGEARAQLARRDALAADGSTAAGLEAGAEAKKRLLVARNRLQAMDEGLRDMAEARSLGEGEVRRRKDLLSAAKGERDGLEKLSMSVAGGAAAAGREGPALAGDKAALLGRGGAAGNGGGGWGVTRTGTGTTRRVLGAPLPETERTRELDNAGVLQLQRQQMAEQDQDVEGLAKIVRRQKEMGLAIQSEVAAQNAMLDDFGNNVDRMGAKVDVAKKKVRKLGM